MTDDQSATQASETADGIPTAADGDSPLAGADAPAGDSKTDPLPEFELVTITYRGKSWNVPKDRGLWDMNVQFEFEEGRRMVGLFTLLGGSPENVSAAKAQVYSVCRTNREVDAFMDHCTEVLNKECTG